MTTSLFAIGLLLVTVGSSTVISKVVNGQLLIWPGAQVGT